MIGTETAVLPTSGQPVRMGCKLPPELRYSAVPTWAETNPVIPEEQWEEHDEYAAFGIPIKHQHANNCTNASLAGLSETLWTASGNPFVELSMAYLYALCNGGVDEGAFCRDLAAKLLSVGIPTAKLVPESQVTARAFSSDVASDAGTRKALEIYQCLNWQDVGSALSRRFLVYHGFCLGGRFFSTGSDGLVPAYDGAYTNGHAQYSRGLRKVNGVWRTVTPNSWDVTFGDKGVGYIDASYFWAQKGNFVNLDCYAVRAFQMPTTGIPAPAAG